MRCPECNRRMHLKPDQIKEPGIGLLMICPKGHEAPSRSGSSRTYAEKKRSGRPTVTFCLPVETIDRLGELADETGMSRSAVVAEAIEKYKPRRTA